MSEYEKIIQSIGSFGPYQIRVFVLINAVEIALAWVLLLPVLVSPSANWKCNMSLNNLNSMNSLYKSLVQVTNDTVTDHLSNTCSMHGSICPGIEYTDDVTTIISEWNLVCNRDYVADLATSLNILGIIIGGIVGGQLADTFGRRYVLYSHFLIMLLVSFGSAFAQTWIAYIVLRFIIGWLYGGVGVGTRILPMEFITPKWRSFCNCIGFWGLACGLLGVWGYLIRDWRHVTIATSVCSAPLLITFWIVPESPRWLLKKGKIEEAKKTIAAIAKFNKKPTPDLSTLESFVENELNTKEARKKFSYWHLCSTKNRFLTTIILLFLYFASTSVYYGIHLNVTNLSGDRYLNIFLMGIIEIPSNIITMFLANKIGRRKTVSLFHLIVGLCLIAILSITHAGKMEEYAVLVQIFAFIGKGCLAGGYDAMTLLAIETYPTIIRAIGSGMMAVAGKLGAALAPQLLYLNKISKSLPYGIFGSMAISVGVLVFLLKETADSALPDGLKDRNNHEESDSNIIAENNVEM